MAFWRGKDAVSREVELPQCPERIVSLVPSQTELLMDLGVGSRLVGRTRYCIHPREELSRVAVVGGTKQVDLKKLRELQPDLILGEKEETPRDLVGPLSDLAPVYITDVVSIPSALSMCQEAGKIVGCAAEGMALATRIEEAMEGVRGLIQKPERVLYLIWKKPWMGVGSGTFIQACLEHLGFESAIPAGEFSSRYPELTAGDIRKLAPDRVFLSSEPYPFREKHAAEILEIVPSTREERVDGELFSWYGSRMLRMPDYWRKLFLPTGSSD